MSTPPRKVAVLVGSLRAGSFSRMAVRALADVAPGLALEIVEIGQLPFYNQDEDGDAAPPSYADFRAKVKAADAVLFVTPEYNRSIPGALKNAIDWASRPWGQNSFARKPSAVVGASIGDVGSRPYGHSAWSGKPGAVISITPGALGAFGANHHLRQSLVFLNVPTMQQPEAYVSNAATLFDADGALTSESTRKFFTTFMESFAAWIELHLRAK